MLSSSGLSQTTRISWGISVAAWRIFSMMRRLSPSFLTGMRMESLGMGEIARQAADPRDVAVGHLERRGEPEGLRTQARADREAVVRERVGLLRVEREPEPPAS